MATQSERALLEALSALQAALHELPGPSMIIGGIAVIARGVPRQTGDVDAAVWGEAVSLDTLLATLARHGMYPEMDVPLRLEKIEAEEVQ